MLFGATWKLFQETLLDGLVSSQFVFQTLVVGIHWLTHTSQSQVKMLAIMQNKKIPRLWKCRNNIRNDNQSVFDICLVFIWDQITDQTMLCSGH